MTSLLLFNNQLEIQASKIRERKTKKSKGNIQIGDDDDKSSLLYEY